MLVWPQDNGKCGERLAWDATGPGVFRGEGLFETLLVQGRTVFAWHQHWERLENGAKKVRLALPSQGLALELLSEFIRGEISDEDESARRLRVTALQEGLFFGMSEVGELPKQHSLVISPFCRNERSPLAGLKAVSYAENILALEEAKARGATEALLANTQGDWCEGTWSNIFLVKDETLFTPPLSSGCLPGVTRALVLEVAEKAGISIQETEKPLSWLEECEEMFLTSSLRGVCGVSEFEGRTLALGELTLRIRELYEQKLSQLRLVL